MATGTSPLSVVRQLEDPKLVHNHAYIDKITTFEHTHFKDVKIYYEKSYVRDNPKLGNVTDEVRCFLTDNVLSTLYESQPSERIYCIFLMNIHKLGYKIKVIHNY